MYRQDTSTGIGLLAIGVGVVFVLSAALFTVSTERGSMRLDESPPEALLDELIRTEFRHLIAGGHIGKGTTIALDPQLDREVVALVQAHSPRWTFETHWPENRGVPPAGTVLVRSVELDGERGYISVLIGDTAGLEACGVAFNVEYVWIGGWRHRSGSWTMC